MSSYLSILGYLGLLIAAPAIFIALRVAIRLLLSFLTPNEKISLTYTDANGVKYKKKIHVKKNDDLLKALDAIAEKNRREGRTHG